MIQKNILIIDDDISIRFVFKKLLQRNLAKDCVKVYTASNGVDGLGLAYIIKPQIIIIDTTLPKYSGREFIDYLITNDAFSKTPIIVLHNEKSNFKELLENYFQISKKDKAFPSNLIEIVLKRIVERNTFENNQGRLFEFTSFLCKQIVWYSNKSNISSAKISDSKKYFGKFANFIRFVFYQVVTSLYLCLFYLFLGKDNNEEEIVSNDKELDRFRTKLYPAIAITIATAGVIVVGAVLILGSVLGITILNKETIRAATSYTWDGGGTDEICGGNVGDGNKWSCAENWSPDGVPTAGDTVTFNGTSTKDVIVDSEFTGSVASINIAAGYSGTITLQRSLRTTSTFTASAGTFDASNETLDVDGAFTMNAGSTFTASSGTTYVGGDFKVNGGNFNAHDGTVMFDGLFAALSCNNVIFSKVDFDVGVVAMINSNCNLPVGDNPEFSGTGLIVLNGGTLNGSGILTSASGSLDLYGTANIVGFSGLSVNAKLGVNTSGPVDFSNYSTFSVGELSVSDLSTVSLPSGAQVGKLRMQSSGATLNLPSGILTISSDLSITDGTFNANGGTVNFTGTSSTLLCNNVAFNLVTFNHVGTKTVSSDCTLPLGDNPVLSGFNSIISHGTLTGTGLLSKELGTLTMNAGSSLSGFDELSLRSFVVAGATADFSAYNSFHSGSELNLSSGTLTLPTIGADIRRLIISGGEFNAPSGVMTISDVLTISGVPTFNANGGTISFVGLAAFSGSASLSCNNVIFNNITFNNDDTRVVSNGCTFPLGEDPTLAGAGDIVLEGALTGAGTLTKIGGALILNASSSLSGFTGLSVYSFGVAGAVADFSSYGSLTINDTFFIDSGSFTAPSIMSVGANWVNNGGTFNHNNGTVILTDSLSIQAGDMWFKGSNSNTFYNLTKTVSSPRIIYFPSYVTQTIRGTLTLKGISGNYLKVKSSDLGKQYNINAENIDIDYLDVQDSNNVSANVIQVGTKNIIDSGNNTGWNFYDPSVVNLGPSNLVNDSWGNNIVPTFTFNVTDPDVDQDVRYRIQISKDFSFSDLVIDYISILFPQGEMSFMTGQDFEGTYNVGDINTKLTSQGKYWWRVMGIDETGGESGYTKANFGYNSAFRIDTEKPLGNVSLALNTLTEEVKDIFIFPYATDDVSGVSNMRISETSDFAGTNWEDYKTTKEYTFTTEGNKTIYIKYRDSGGNESLVYSSITTVQSPEIEAPRTNETITVNVSVLFVDKDNRPIKNLEVTIVELGITVKTNEEGYAIFEGIQPGNYTVTGIYEGEEFVYDLIVYEDSNVITMVVEKDDDQRYIIIVCLILLMIIVLPLIVCILFRKRIREFYALR